ncbi:MAG: transcription elongation factor GreA [Acidobacteriota bacterium]
MKEAKKKLETEIKKLERELKDELPKALTKAIELGDLSENAEYQTAKERQSLVQAQLSYLHTRLAKLSLVDLSKIPTDKISYGSTVVLADLDSDRKVTYRLVSSEESDVSKGLISTVSPIGKSLMGHEDGDSVEIRTPGGVKNYEIVSFKTLYDNE